MDFNSPLLKAMPRRESPKTGRTLRRMTIVLFLAALVVVPVLLVVTRGVPDTGLGHALYWFHDYIFLPIKAYTYTLFYPYSLAFWGTVFFLIILWIISYLSADPIFRHLQVYLARKAVKRKIFQPLLVKTTRRLKKWRIEPILLKEVTAEQRKKALFRLAALPSAQVDRDVITSAVRLTLLHTRLLTLPLSRPEAHLEAAVYWQEVSMRLRPHLKNSTGVKHDRLEKLAAELEARVHEIIAPLLDYKNPQQLEAAREKTAGFDAQTLALDLLYLVSLRDNDTAAYMLGAQTPREQREILIARRLAQSTAARRAFLDRNRIRLENRSNLYHTDFLTAGLEELPLLGRLSLLIALDLAALSGTPAVGLGIMESIETLDFVLHLRQPEVQETQTSEEPKGYRKLLQLVNGLPEPADYRFCAELAEKETKEQKEIWQRVARSIPSKQGPVLPGDFELAESRIEALYHAAGPDFDGGVAGPRVRAKKS